MATAATGKAGNENPDLEADIKQLKADLEKLAKQMATTSEHGYGTASGPPRWAPSSSCAGEAKLEELRASAKDIEEQILATVREKPVTALAIAAGIGYLFALLARR